MFFVVPVTLISEVWSKNLSDNFESLAMRCAPSVAPDTLRALVKTESGFNPYAIGVVGGSVKQPSTFQEAMTTIANLELSGANYSVGLAQINKKNFAPYSIDAMKALDGCANLKVAAQILGKCFTKAQKQGKSSQKALHDALSCYYSGNFKTGYEHGYVNKVRTNAGLVATVPSIKEETQKGDLVATTSTESTYSNSSLVTSVQKGRRGLIF